jgi:hypothetical protein
MPNLESYLPAAGRIDEVATTVMGARFVVRLPKAAA